MVTITVTKFGESQNPSPNLVKKIALFYSQYTLVFLPHGASTQLDVQKYESDILRILKVEEILGKLKIQLEKLTSPLNHLEARGVPSHKSCKGRSAFSSIFILTKVALHS